MDARFGATVGLAGMATFAAVWALTAPPATTWPAAQAVAPPPSDGRPVHAATRAHRHAHRPRRRASRTRVVRIASATSPAAGVFYPGCNEVRALGRAPLYRGQPGYREDMDGDLDGIACEPHQP